MNIADILKWAAGSSRPLPDFRGVSDQRLLELLGVDPVELLNRLLEHRLPQRFLWRYCAERPAWASQWLLDQLCQSQQAAQQHLVRHLNAVAEIQAALPAREAPLVVLKGATTFALCGDPKTLRYSSDLDLCYHDLPLLWEVLHSLGYRGKRHFTHEYGKVLRDDITIDLHEYFPVLSYPPGLTPHDFTHPNSGPVVLSGPQHFAEAHIDYECLRQYAIQSPVPQTSTFVVAGASLATLLLCAHTFKNLAVGGLPYLASNRILKLAELCEIADLTRSSGFDASQFQELVVRYNASDTVTFCAHLLDYYGISHALPVSEGEPQAMRFGFPENLRWGGWALLNNEDDLLFPCDFTETLRRLGLNSVPVADCTACPPEQGWTGSHALDATITSQVTPGPSIPFKMRALHDDRQLVFELSLDLDHLSHVNAFFLHFGTDVWVEVALEQNQAAVRHKFAFDAPDVPAVDSIQKLDSSLIRVTIPRHALPDLKLQSLFSLFALQAYAGKNVTYVPLQMQFS